MHKNEMNMQISRIIKGNVKVLVNYTNITALKVI